MLQDMLNGRAILVLEDDYFIAMDVEDTLRRAGATVVGPVGSVREALDLVDTVTLDAAVLDVTVRDGDAHPVAEALRFRGVPFVLASGNPHVGDGFSGAPAIEKPVRSRDLLAAVDAILRGRPSG